MQHCFALKMLPTFSQLQISHCFICPSTFFEISFSFFLLKLQSYWPSLSGLALDEQMNKDDAFCFFFIFHFSFFIFPAPISFLFCYSLGVIVHCVKCIRNVLQQVCLFVVLRLLLQSYCLVVLNIKIANLGKNSIFKNVSICNKVNI